MNEATRSTATATARTRPARGGAGSLGTLAVVVALLLIAASAVLAFLAVRLTNAPSAHLAGEFVLPGSGIAAPAFNLHDQDGNSVSLSTLHGRVVVLTFIDSTCTNLCPIQADQIAAAQRKLNPASAYSLVAISVAPKKDNPQNEKVFADIHKWSGDWHWLSGSTAQLAPVWKSYGVYVVSDSQQNVEHSTTTFVIDPDGYERAGFVTGINSDQLAQDVKALQPQSFWSRVF